MYCSQENFVIFRTAPKKTRKREGLVIQFLSSVERYVIFYLHGVIQFRYESSLFTGIVVLGSGKLFSESLKTEGISYHPRILNHI